MMTEKFKYAPGRPGFGTRGNDGSAGPQGLSMYFTDYNPVSQASNINNAIANNYVLWSISPNVTLPAGRTYISGDLFVDNEGKIYEINAEANTFTYIFGNLNTAGYFVSAEVSTSSYNYNRYYNSNGSPKYIIDNVYADGAISYYEIPSEIYDIESKNFTRIEYCNMILNGYNPFTIYSSGKTQTTDDASAIALVREIATNTFRLGNLDNTGALRNVNLIFDVSSLVHTKQANVNEFNLNTPDGAILTNYEINANALFTGCFDASPATFRAGFSPTEVSIFWTLSDFTSDTDVNADLYFMKDCSKSGSISFVNDASNYRPLIFHDLAASGILNFTDLDQSTSFKCFINFHKNGWERRSRVLTPITGAIPYIYVYPSSVTTTTAAKEIGFCVSSNVAWAASLYTNPTLFMSDISTNYSYGTGDVSLYINVSENTLSGSRIGVLKIEALSGGGNSPRYITVKQSGTSTEVTVNVVESVLSTTTTGYILNEYLDCSIYITGLPSDTYIDVSVVGYSLVSNTNDSEDVIYDNYMNVIGVAGVDTAPGNHAGTYSPDYLDSLTKDLIQEIPNKTYVDVSIFKVRLRLYEAATPYATPNWHYNTSVTLTDVSVKYKSGSPITISNLNLNAQVNESYFEEI